MARIHDRYGFEFDSSEAVLDDRTLARIIWAASQAGGRCNGFGDFAVAYADLEKAARQVLALRALHDRAERVKSGREN
jgi:hypothetical protein